MGIKKNTVVRGCLVPSLKNKPLDGRQDVPTLADIVNIENPYVNFIFPVAETGKWYKVISLRNKVMGDLEIPDGEIDKYDLFGEGLTEEEKQKILFKDLAEETYLKKEDATETYQPKGEYQTKGNYVTKEDADNSYQPKGEYQIKGDYITPEVASNTYQLKGEYVTKKALDEFAETIDARVEEAPKDDKIYSRSNGAWVEVDTILTHEIVIINLFPTDEMLYGASVKVTSSDGEVLLDEVWQGENLSVNIEEKTQYTVEVGDVERYIAPEPVTYTAIKGATRTIDMVYVASSLKMNILSNQGITDSDISGVKAFVTYGETSVEVGNGEIVGLPQNVDVTITFPDVDNYKAPSSISFHHQGGFQERSGTYLTEVVSVTLSSDNGVIVAGQKVTINGIEQTWDGTNAITQKVAFGTQYSVSANGKDGYMTPSVQNFTASQSSRNLSMVYEVVQYGVYIQGISGTLYKQSDWNNQEDVNGVALYTEKCAFVMSPAFVVAQGVSYWSDIRPDLPMYQTEEGALQDFNGEYNTRKMIEKYNINLNPNPLAYVAANNYIFPNGNNGYLGALGENDEIQKNITEITNAYSLIGKDITNYIKQGYSPFSQYWSSTLYGFDKKYYDEDTIVGYLWYGTLKGAGSNYGPGTSNKPHVIPLQKLVI